MEQVALENAHYRKIELSDAIYVVDIQGYIGNQVSKETAFAKSKGKEVVFHSAYKKINVPFLSEIFVIYIRHIQNIKQYIGYREISGYEGLVACGERFMSYKEFMLYAVGRNIRISYGWSGIQILIPTGDFLF